MAKVIVASLRSRSESNVVEKKVLTPEGKPRRVLTVDAASPTLGGDLKYVFTRNVAKARRDNKRLTGANDVVLPKD